MRRTKKATEKITCVSCLAQNKQFDAFCHNCGSPIGAVAAIDPLQRIQTEGFFFRKMLEGRPKPIVLLGVWIIFLPLLLVSIGVAYSCIIRRGPSDFGFFWMMVALSCLAFFFLYRVTKNYLAISKHI